MEAGAAGLGSGAEREPGGGREGPTWPPPQGEGRAVETPPPYPVGPGRRHLTGSSQSRSWQGLGPAGLLFLPRLRAE